MTISTMERPLATNINPTGKTVNTGLNPLDPIAAANIQKPTNQRPSIRFNDKEWESVTAVIERYKTLTFAQIVKSFFEVMGNGGVMVSAEQFAEYQQLKAEKEASEQAATKSTKKGAK